MKSMIGSKYGRLTVIERAHKASNGTYYYKCKCDCGNECIVRGDHLRSGHTTSCGCAHGGGPKVKDLLGQRFGKLVVIEFAGLFNKRAHWKCLCDCGNTIVVRSDHLCDGLTTSCGCTKSKGEEIVGNILNKLNVNYSKEYSFSDLKDKGLLKFDFAIHKDQLFLIEYDGEQHFKSSSGWNSPEEWEKLHQRDIQKNEYCIQHNIPLLRLNYTQNLKEIEEEIKKFLDIK